jgi:hypothetical protein
MSDQPDQKRDEQELTFERLGLRAVANEDRMLELPVEDGWREFPIPGGLSVPTMARLLLIEKRINDGDTGDLEKMFTDAVGEIMRIVRVRTPDASEPNMDEFSVQRISAAIAWIAGDVSVAESFRSALTAGAPVPSPQELVATAHAASEETTADDDAHGHGEDPGPLVSSELSSTRSSGSDEHTAGSQSGGETAAGERSVSTSETLTSV